MGHGLVDVLILSGECVRIDDREINLVTEQVVEVNARQLVLAAEESLLESRLECAVLLRLQIGIRHDEWRIGNKQFFKTRVFNTGRIRKAEPRSRKNLATLYCQQC